ncbi:mastermind-like protein 1 isoform X2 [Phycodurus eques]|uniref:mastermind-like protein 1 isoform X2 n=1 Tax=Phycodurus eques TaxID=693459 RepID=UPI002ACD7877|nr:mastermind-like protein 1 isoform X2 [Phycodurus eques]
MMADFVTPRHSAVMERLRRRIELFRQHHNSCESRYEAAALESLELERQQTFALHQRCLQAKAKRTNKHRQPPAAAAAEQGGQRAPGSGGGASAELGDGGGGGGAAEQSRNSTLIAETVKRKLESAGSPLDREQVNGFSDGFPASKKACVDAAGANGSPVDSKLGLGDALASNGTRGELAAADGAKEAAADFRRKEMKQEPDDILPIMPPSGGGNNNNNNLFPDLNFNEQEWTELMEELNRTVAYEDIQDILNDGFEDRKDPLEMTPNPGGGGATGGGAQSSQSLLPLDLGSVKAEFSPSPFEQDSRTGSPHVRSASSGPSRPTGSPVAASSPAAPLPRQHPPPPPPPNHLLAKDLSPAQQLQQLAAQQQRAQHLHTQLQHKQPPPAGAKFHGQGPPHAHPPPWTQLAGPPQSPLGPAFGMDKAAGPSLYPQDFNSNAQKQRLMSVQPPKGSPKAGANSFAPGGAGHPSVLGHPAQGPPLNHPPAPGAQAAVLNYNNTKPLSHFEAGPGPPRPPNGQNQNKAALLSLLRQQQQQQQQMKQKNNMNFRQHLTHTQDQNSYPTPSHGPGQANALTSAAGNGGMAAPPGPNALAGNHSNTAYLNSQAAALKQQQQQQILEQQKQQYLQRQQMMAEQEKQRQQDQQLQRHLTRPPPQYQDQPGQTANQNAFPQTPVSQFTGPSLASVSSMGGPAPAGQRMFPQPQGMMGIKMAAGGVPPPPTASQADLGLTSCGGDVQQVLYNNMNLHPGGGHAPQQRQPMYRHALLAQQQQQQQHLNKQPNAALLKQQQMAAARMPANMQASPNAVWQQQGLAPNAFANAPNAFHMQQQQQPRIPKMTAGSAAAFNANPAGRPMAGMMQSAQQRAPSNPQSLGPPQTQHQQATQNHPTNQNVLPDLAAFGAAASGGRPSLACNQGYQVSRTANQQQLSFGYNAAAGSFAAESDLVESLLKGQSTHEWMADLDELLASHQ